MKLYGLQRVSYRSRQPEPQQNRDIGGRSDVISLHQAAQQIQEFTS